MDFGYLMLVFIAMAAVTFAERALPFAASKWLQNRKQMAAKTALGKRSGRLFASCHYGAFDRARRNRRGRGA